MIRSFQEKAKIKAIQNKSGTKVRLLSYLNPSQLKISIIGYVMYSGNPILYPIKAKKTKNIEDTSQL